MTRSVTRSLCDSWASCYDKKWANWHDFEKYAAVYFDTSLGTNLIHDFTAVTFSVKLAFFREKRPFPCFRDFSWISTLLLSFMKVLSVLSTAFVRILLFATCHTAALSSWHVLLCYLLTFSLESWLITLITIINIRCSEISNVLFNRLPLNNSCGAREFLKLLLWILAHFKNSTMKSHIFSHELGWSLHIASSVCKVRFTE